MLFNTDFTIWNQKATKQKHARLLLGRLGSVFSQGEIIARFESYEKAKSLLVSVGYIVDGENATTQAVHYNEPS